MYHSSQFACHGEACNGRNCVLCGFLQARLVLIQQRLQFRRQEFLEPGIDDIFSLQQFYGSRPSIWPRLGS